MTDPVPYPDVPVQNFAGPPPDPEHPDWHPDLERPEVSA